MSTLEQVASRKLSPSEFPRSEPPRSDPVRPEPARSEPPRIVAHCVVVDAGNSTVVSIGTQIPSLIFVRDSLMDTLSYVGVVAPEVLEIKASDPRAYPEWSFDYRSRTFSKTNPAIITEGMRERAVMATKKMEIIGRASYLINRARDKVNTGLLFQETIYATKEKQAQQLKDAGFDQALAVSVPYVVQYADESGMSLQDAAEDILFQAQLFHEHLEKTERVRLALYRKIRRARSAVELDEIMERFQREGVA